MSEPFLKHHAYSYCNAVSFFFWSSLYFAQFLYTHRPIHCLSLFSLAASATVYVHHRSPLSCSPINMPTDSRTICGYHFLWYGKAILYFISLFICSFVKEMPLAVYYAPLAGKKYLQKESRRLPASCNASLVHCLRTNVSTMFWANKLLYSQAIWCRKRQSWRSRVRLNAASGSVREWFIWNYCCALLQRVGYWCVCLKWLLQEGDRERASMVTHTASLSSTGHRPPLSALHFTQPVICFICVVCIELLVARQHICLRKPCNKSFVGLTLIFSSWWHKIVCHAHKWLSVP